MSVQVLGEELSIGSWVHSGGAGCCGSGGEGRFLEPARNSIPGGQTSAIVHHLCEAEGAVGGMGRG